MPLDDEHRVNANCLLVRIVRQLLVDFLLLFSRKQEFSP
jgi:hypothetical protein